jgi:hypothetical protein
LRALLEDEERAIRAVDTAALNAAAALVEEEVRGSVARERRRTELMRAFGRAFGADPRALSLTSLAERLGAGTREAEAVLQLRGELRQAAAEVSRLAGASRASRATTTSCSPSSWARCSESEPPDPPRGAS